MPVYAQNHTRPRILAWLASTTIQNILDVLRLEYDQVDFITEGFEQPDQEDEAWDGFARELPEQGSDTVEAIEEARHAM